MEAGDPITVVKDVFDTIDGSPASVLFYGTVIDRFDNEGFYAMFDANVPAFHRPGGDDGIGYYKTCDENVYWTHGHVLKGTPPILAMAAARALLSRW